MLTLEVRKDLNNLKFYLKKLENCIEPEAQIKQEKGNHKYQSRNQWHGNQKNRENQWCKNIILWEGQ